MMNAKQRNNAGQASKPVHAAPLRGWPLFSALFAVVIYAGMIIVLVATSSGSDVVWTRLVYVFASIQAFAFAAAGALWGTSISQARAERAEKLADSKSEDASKGRALAAAILADSAASSDEDPDRNTRGRPAAVEVESRMAARHAAIALQMFPDLKAPLLGTAD